MTDLLVRSRRPGDAAALVAALVAVHAQDAYPVRASRVCADWLLGGAELAWVAQLDGRVVGHVGLSRTDDGWELTRFFVAVDARDSGAGSALLDVAEAWARADGETLVLVVVEHHHDARRLYVRRGWTPTDPVDADFLADDGSRPRLVPFRFATA